MWRRALPRWHPRPLAALGLVAALPARGHAACWAEEDWRAKASELQKQLDELKNRAPAEQRAPCRSIVLTGGPCAGKTTVMAVLKEKLENLGFLVFTVPEASTLFHGVGMRFSDFAPLGENALAAVQAQLTRTQIHLENCFKELARVQNRPTVILCDRGAMDGKAYISRELWALTLEDLGATEGMLRDKRYDAVLHLVTAAHGAEEFYSLQQAEGSGPRFESVEQAKVQDAKTLSCWVGHPHFFIIDNSTDFRGKVQRVLDRVLSLLGEPVPGHTLRKFRVPFLSAEAAAEALKSAGVENSQVFRAEQIYLTERRRIRMRAAMDGQQAFYNAQEFLEGGAVLERQIDGREYLAERCEAQRRGVAVCRKELVVFQWGSLLLELNIFHEPDPVCVVEVEAESRDVAIALPGFLSTAGPIEEITDDADFDSLVISQKIRAATAL